MAEETWPTDWVGSFPASLKMVRLFPGQATGRRATYACCGCHVHQDLKALDAGVKRWFENQRQSSRK